MYRVHTDIWGRYWGHKMYGDMQGMYRCMGDVQKYGEHTDVWRMYRCMGYTDVEVTLTPHKHTDSQTYPHLPTTPGYYISYKI